MITHFNGDYYMSSNGLFCGVNAPPAKDKNSGGGLPPYAKCKAFLTDDYKCVPQNWMQSSGRMASYFIGVNDNSGMWLDFNKNSQHAYEVAIVISVQGINPITGLPCKDACLEQYIDDCPKCKAKFKANRYCETCGYNWPKQNYICTTGQPNGELWLDGFRAADGIIRQWIFSEEEKKGVASNIIGEDRVFAIGISFFLSKEKKKEMSRLTRSISYGADFDADSITYGFKAKSFTKSLNKESKTSGIMHVNSTSSSSSSTPSSGKGGSSIGGTFYPVANVAGAYAASEEVQLSCDNNSCDNISVMSATLNARSIDVTKLEVAAGNEINQKIHDDPNPLDFWRNEPESIIVINYGFEKEIKQIISGGKKIKTTKKEGFLAGIPVGN